MKVVLAHDYLNQWGGAERVLSYLTEVYPAAPVYTLFYDEKFVEDFFSGKKIISSQLQKSKIRSFSHKYLLPFLPLAVESLNIEKTDVVLSSTTAWMKGLVLKPDVCHICYCHSPTRFLWDWHSEYLEEQKLGKIKKTILTPLLTYLRMWDYAAAQRVDFFITNSQNTRKRIQKYYHKDAAVIYPPVDTSKFKVLKNHDDYFLVVSRLSPYKNVALAVKAFNKLGLPLVIIGEGSQKEELKNMAGKNIIFAEAKTDAQLVDFYARARAVIFPTFDEDFGLVPVEAMAAGRPVIAAGRGGTRESIVEGVSGEFFNENNPQSLIQAVQKFIENEKNYNPGKIRKIAEKFDVKIFKKKIEEFVNKSYEEFKKQKK